MKTSIIIAITAAASILSITLPGIIEHFGEGLHLATLVISGNHILEELRSSIHQQQKEA